MIPCSLRCHRVSLLALLATLITTGPLHGQEEAAPRVHTLPGIESPMFPYAKPEEVGLSSAQLDELADEVARWVANGELVGAEIMIVKARKIALHEAIGWSDRERGLPMQRNSIFRMRSMTKPFIGTAVLILAEKGTLSLDDPVAKYLPSFDNERSQDITIRQLLTRTGGFVHRGFAEKFDSYMSLREAVDAVGEAGPQHPPGSGYRYSDVGSATLGAIVAEVSGMLVERFIETRILEPLGMTTTFTHFTPEVPWADRMNSTYYWSDEENGFKKYWDNTKEQRYRFFRAAGGLYSTIMDYAKFLAMWMDRGRLGSTQILSEASVEEALRPGSAGGYGLHWFVPEAPSSGELPPVFGHGGSDGTLAMAFPSADAMVFYFTQSRGHDYRTTFARYAGDLFDHPGPSTPYTIRAQDREWLDVDLSSAKRALYAGSYEGERGTFRVWEQDGLLHATASGDVREVHLVPVGHHTFALGWYRHGRPFEILRPSFRIRFVVENGKARRFEVLYDERVIGGGPRLK